jgi:lysylphosphatidylglycerol synthetase-like protein (DUF2156 family)
MSITHLPTFTTPKLSNHFFSYLNYSSAFKPFFLFLLLLFFILPPFSPHAFKALLLIIPLLFVHSPLLLLLSTLLLFPQLLFVLSPLLLLLSNHSFSSYTSTSTTHTFIPLLLLLLLLSYFHNYYSCFHTTLPQTFTTSLQKLLFLK